MWPGPFKVCLGNRSRLVDQESELGPRKCQLGLDKPSLDRHASNVFRVLAVAASIVALALCCPTLSPSSGSRIGPHSGSARFLLLSLAAFG